jgi:hypothetical protein
MAGLRTNLPYDPDSAAEHGASANLSFDQEHKIDF